LTIAEKEFGPGRRRAKFRAVAGRPENLRVSSFSRRPRATNPAWGAGPTASTVGFAAAAARFGATGLALAALLLTLVVLAPTAHAASGGLGATYSGETVETPSIPASAAETETPGVSTPSGVPIPAPTVPGATATLAGERAVAPASAPTAVKQVIAAANRIRATPYVWGGGHGRWWDRGYDCSGAVSYALHGATLLEAPLVSGSLMTWGEPGPGSWITIYANRAHVYAVVAGLRWDTGGDLPGVTGPRWHPEAASARGFVVRHPAGY
jgi:cell wall-associated NlpC family hydrolase